jgi:hypothetical protein
MALVVFIADNRASPLSPKMETFFQKVFQESQLVAKAGTRAGKSDE